MHSFVHSASSPTGLVDITIFRSGQLSDVKFRSLGFIQSWTTQILQQAPGFSIKVLNLAFITSQSI